MPSTAHDVETSAETVAAQFVSPFQIAKLVERAGQTDLRVGIQAGEFGSVDIRTSMAHSQFTAEISVERGELGRAMSAELPSLHDRLAEQRVPPANIILQDHSYSQSGSSDLRQGTRQQQYTAQSQTADGCAADLNPAIIAMETMESGAGLDIHI
jgi:flagellar hook-length control protein FliK